MLTLRKRFCFCVFCITISLFLHSRHIHGQTSDLDAKSLRGIKALQVTVEDLNLEAMQSGLSRDLIQTDVELRLRKVGIPIIPENYRTPMGIRLSTVEKLTGLKRERAREKWEETHGQMRLISKEEEELEKLYNTSASIYINAHVMRLRDQQSPHFIYNIRVELQQVAVLHRDTSITSYGAVTWNRGSLGIVPANEMVRTVRDAVADLVDTFLNAYLSQNPK